MKMPPLFATVSVSHPDGDEENGFTLWVPLFIIVPLAMIILLALFLVALPFLLLSFMFTWEADWVQWLARAAPAFFKMGSELPGLHINVLAGRQKVFIDVR
jgi:hypothetical protein